MTTEMTLRTHKKTAIAVGVLFIIATVSAIISVVVLAPHITDPDYLTHFSASANQVVIGALLDLTGAGAFVALAVVLFPVLKKHHETIALGYVVARIIEAVPFIIANISLLSLITLSKEYLAAPALEAAYFVPAGSSLLAAYDWNQLIGPRVFASLAAVPFYSLLYQSKLLPRWISVWGLLGAPLYLASGLFGMFGVLDPASPILILLFLPAALLEMVMAVWLIAKGFNPSAITSHSA